ncbi:uncharacterized protein C227.17c isoform X2 [Papaver somniferum]|uniref:uncharacterized protein C227.17c isoform X2 n=1 Tax=Papaver somniferum TaxID=3469 RepID=UPI000E6F6DA2|nr:uncharacterized protein C227.17c isoform X2 [Papaver somniferum]
MAMEVERKDGEEEGKKSSPKLSCIKYFDSLGFCYSPVYQMQQYYRLGTFDNCFQKWNALFDCLSLKTKRASEEILKAREESKTHIWSFRTKEEAATHWQELHGHINDEP